MYVFCFRSKYHSTKNVSSTDAGSVSLESGFESRSEGRSFEVRSFSQPIMGRRTGTLF